MKRFASWLIVFYALMATVGGGLHILFVDETPVLSCDETSTHLCGTFTPHHNHDAHTCPTCQSGFAADIRPVLLWAGPDVRFAPAPPAGTFLPGAPDRPLHPSRGPPAVRPA